MKSHLLASLALPLLLTQCVDPYYYGPNGRDPYANNPYRQDMRDQGTEMNRQAYERGIQDGRSDAQQRQAQDYRRYSSRFDRNTEMAYRDGYNQGYALMRNSQGELGGAYGNGYGAQPTQPQQPARDPAYNQGYDYGLRDRTSGRVADPAAHVGRYDPRYRSSFERGYYDAFNAGSSTNTPAGPGSGSNLWFR
ncbi:hypothetical protein [Prosthecobacter sp.]|uniref:hypothetical protein n=1 Tax=Prosthecobacter sp. TaxID=1965333 RepID=UPI001DBBF571|nr:hypothetical protein [Prosthecobacter sp.]MCB1279837.1 hypothetical protein [Prosthecobacter sp.]